MVLFYPLGFMAGSAIAPAVRISSGASQRFRRTGLTIQAGKAKNTWSIGVRRRASALTYLHTVYQATTWSRLYIDGSGYVIMQDWHTPGPTADTNVVSDATVPAETWTHLHVVRDTTLAAGSRIRIWLDGVESTVTVSTAASGNATTFGVLTTDYPGGYDQRAASYGSGSCDLANFWFLNGVATAVTEFGEDIGGTWTMKEPTSPAFGTNGFWMSYADADNLGSDDGNGTTVIADNITSAEALGDGPAYVS